MTTVKTIDNICTATWLLFVLIILNIFDFYTTYSALQLGATEANPAMNYLMKYTGTVWSLLVIKVVVLSAVIVPYYTIQRKKNVWKSGRMTYILIGLNLLYLYVVVSNSHKLYSLMILQP